MTPKKPKPDPLAASLERSLDDERAAVERRFNDADRHAAATTTSPPATPKPAVIRANFSFPAADHELLEELQSRCYAAGFSASRSELVRAGLHVLTDLADRPFKTALSRVEKLRPGPRRRT